jgi:hypothetical protein
MLDYMMSQAKTIIIKKVRFKGDEYIWNGEFWYDAKTNIKVPLYIATELNNNFTTSKLYPTRKTTKFSWGTKRILKNYQGGIPGLGKRK